MNVGYINNVVIMLIHLPHTFPHSSIVRLGDYCIYYLINEMYVTIQRT